MGLELTVRISQELERQVAEHKATAYKSVDVAQYIVILSTVPVKIKSFLQVFVNKRKPNEIRQERFEFPDNTIRFLLLAHRVPYQCRRDEHLPLPQQVKLVR